MEFIKNKVPFCGCLFILIIFYLKNLNLLFIPSICLDEIGYWSAAAYWNGQNWSGVMGNFSPYYSYGYSVILFLLMKIFKNAETLHQSAIVVNVFMVAGGYYILNYLTKWIFPEIHKNVRNVICLVPFFYPSIQFHTQTAWSETYLCFLFLLSVVILKKLYEGGRTIFYFLFGLILFDLYITHQRSIGIVVIGILLVFILGFLKKKRLWQSVIFVVTVIVLMTGSSFIKKSLYENVYTDTTIIEESYENETGKTEDNNDFDGQKIKIKYLFSVEGFKNFLISYGGKIFYFVLASFFLGGMGIWYMLENIINYIRGEKYDSEKLFVYCYILGSFFGTMAVAALFMIYPGRIDTVAYGRYTDWLGIIIITLGIFQLIFLDAKKIMKRFLWQVFYCLFFLVIFEQYIVKYNVSNFYSSCSQIMSYFNQIDQNNMLKLMVLIIVATGTILVVCSFIKIINCKTLIISVFLITIWIRITNPSIADLIHVQFLNVIYPAMEKIEENPNRNVYYLYNDFSCRTSNLYTGSIQYMMQDKTLYCVRNLEAIVEETPLIIICESSPVPEGYTVECETRFYKVIKRK